MRTFRVRWRVHERLVPMVVIVVGIAKRAQRQKADADIDAARTRRLARRKSRKVFSPPSSQGRTAHHRFVSNLGASAKDI